MTDKLTPGQLRDLADLIWGKDLPTPPDYLGASIMLEIAEGLRNSAARRERYFPKEINGWRAMDTVPTDGSWFQGLTTHDNVVACTFIAEDTEEGDAHGSNEFGLPGGARFMLKAWQPLARPPHEAARREAGETKRTCGPEVFDAALKSLAASVSDAPPPPADDLVARQPVYEDLPSYLRKLALARNSGITLAAERAPEWKAAAAIEALRAELADMTAMKVAAVNAAAKNEARVAALEDDMRDIAEYWNGSRTDEAMSNALDHIIEVAGKNLAAGGENG